MLNNLFNCLNGLGYPFIFPVHPRLNKFLASNNFPYEKFKNITFISPLSYFDMIDLEINSKIIFTDSGGVQKEAYWCKVPCITLREETEWVELIDIGVNKTVGLNTTNIIIAFTNFMNQSKFSFDDQIYGDGKSGQKILDVLLK